MSDTIWVAIITACATTIPQIIIAIINNRKDLKLKKFEHFNQNRLNIVLEFLESVGEIYSKDGISTREKTKYQKCVNKLLLYFPNLDSSEFKKIFDSTKEWDDAKRCEAMQPIIKQLSKSISEI